MKKLLFVVSAARFFLSHRLALAKAARQAGYEVHVAAPSSEHAVQIVEEGFFFHPVRLNRSGLNPFNEILSIFSLWNLYRRIKPDLIHHIAVKSILHGGIAARLAGVPAVVNAVTGLGYLYNSNAPLVKYARWLAERGYKFSCKHKNLRIIFQNVDHQNQFIKNKIVNFSQSVLIPGSGVCMATFSPTREPDEVPLVILASRMLWDKGVGEFIEAIRDLKKKQITARFALVGDIDLLNPTSVLEAQLNEWVKEGLVEWWGERADMPAVMSKAHVVCLPSYHEGLPRVLVEAAASARAIVATDIPGCREIVRNGDNGLLVPVKNSGDLSLAIEALVRNAELREKMGRRGREIVEQEYNIDTINQRTLAVYSELLA